MNKYAHKFTQKTGTFYMPKTIMRPEGFVAEEMAPTVLATKAKKAKVAEEAETKKNSKK